VLTLSNPGLTETNQKEDTAMTSLRKDDQSKGSFHYRSERVFGEQGLWYFRTREGQSLGPFRYETEARQMLDNFINDIQQREQQALKAAIKPQFRMNPLEALAEDLPYAAAATQ
jgi:hypothetical protein